MQHKDNSKVVRREQCPDCRFKRKDTSSDNLVVYEDGHKHCFSCGYHESPKQAPVAIPHDETSLQFVAWRGVTEDTMRFFGVKCYVSSLGEPLSIIYPYGSSGTKIRSLSNKSFVSTGEMRDAGLFGKDRFPSGCSKTITVTEGEQDALSVYQMLGRGGSAVSVRSASQALRDCQQDYEYLNSFERIYLCFDNDEPGQAALKEVAKLFDVNKVYRVDLGKYKDANEILVAGQAELFREIWRNSKRYLPKGIVNDLDSIKDILSKEDNQAIASYPFPTLNNMAYGIRLGELNLITAMEKVGKTEVLRAIEYHILKTTNHKIGIIHLEESEKRSVQGLVGYELGIPVHLPDSGLSVDDQLSVYKSLSGGDGSRINFYTHFGSDDPDAILGIIRYMVGVLGCSFIFLDHISMLVSTMAGTDDERKSLDRLSTRLAMLTRELKFTLFMISHVNDDGQTRGSRMPSKVCDLEVYISRDKENADPEVRNSIRVMVKNNRWGSTTGPGGILKFDPQTFKVTEPDEQEFSPDA